MSSEGSLVSWRPVEEAKWRAVPKLGPEWMCKWSGDERGYWVVLTNGCALWGEARSASSIQDKAEEWAPCIEAEVQKLSNLVLQDLSQMNVKAHWQGREQFQQHWVLPLMVQMHSLSQRVRQLTAEVEVKARQLKDLLPDNSKLVKSPKKKEVRLDKSVEAVVVGGAWSVLQDHLESSPTIMKHLAAHSSGTTAGEPEKAGDREEKGPTPTVTPIKRPTEEELEEEKQKREMLQRAKIQEIQQAADKPSKQTKKKKLKL
ncbi:uncharacterized protein LOC135099839 isoform X3 [Scylla paramamosain]|uniref:uncharacterized protein LOC135099839 isoform X3 n=1 Tax=Scylla paramamosain TaxID=85552 RepID=UPI003083C343